MGDELPRSPFAWVEDAVNRSFWRGFVHGVAFAASVAFLAISLKLFLGGR